MSGSQRNNSRRDKMWVSHNRVLIGGNKKNVRNPNFDTEETKLLISLWGNPAIQKTLITSHKKFPIITKLSETMRGYGYSRTPEEINTRLKNLKCLYNRLKKDVECGIRSNPTWKHFAAMDAILTRPIFGYQNSGDNQDDDEDSGQLLVKDEGEVELEEEDELRPEDLLQLETTPEEHFFHDDDDVTIKEEPIDVEEYERRNESSKAEAGASLNIEKLPKLIPRSSWLNTSSSNGNGTPQCAEAQNPPPLQNSQKVTTRQNSVICVSAPRTVSTVTSTTNSTNIQNGNTSGGMSPGSKAKISLVPTNLLLNQQKQQNAAAAAAAAGKNFYVSSKSMSTITQAQLNQSQGDQNKSKMPMKVLLVNTMPNSSAHHMPNTPTTTTTTSGQSNKAEIIPIPMEQTHQFTYHHHPAMNRMTAQPQPQPQVRRGRPIHRRSSVGQTLTIPGMKSLLGNLIKTQQEANTLNRERLALDKEKFNYEKRVVDQVLGLVPILKDIGTQFLQQQRPSPEQPHLPSSSAPLQCNGVTEEEDDDCVPMAVAAEEEIGDESDT